MRSKFLTILLLSTVWSYGQSVPDTETFSLNDVYTVVNSHTPATTFDLNSCFTNAVAGYFDAAYTGYPANSMLRFRNYTVDCGGPPAVTVSLAYYISTDNCGSYNFTSSESLACAALDIWNDWIAGNSMGCMNDAISGPSLSGYGYRGSSFTVGVQLYKQTGAGTGIWCKSTDTGYYISVTSDKVVYLSGGVIQSIITCP